MSVCKQRFGVLLLLLLIVTTTFIFHFFLFQGRVIIANTGLIGGLILSLNQIKVNSLKDLFNHQLSNK